RFLLPPSPPSPAVNSDGQAQQTPPPPPEPAERERPREQPQAERHTQPDDQRQPDGQRSARAAQPPTAAPPTAASADGQAAPRPGQTTSAAPRPQQPVQPRQAPVLPPLPQRGAPPVGAARPTAPPPPAPAREVDDRGDDNDLSSAWAIKGGALAVVAAGVVAALERLRRARLRRRLPGERLTTPPDQQLRTEQQLRDLAEPDTAEFIELALRALAGWRRKAGQPIPPVDLVSVTDRELALHLHEADHEAPPPWRVSDEGRTWLLPRELDRAALAEQAYGVPAPTPALVTIGSTAGGRRRVLANVSRAQVMGITGEPDQVRLTILTQALELATSRFADYVRVVLVGPRLDELPELERIEVASPYALLDQLEALADWVEQLPDEEDLDEDCTPTVVFCAGIDQRISYGLQQLARRTQGRAVVVVAGPTDAGWSLTVEDDRCHLDPPGLTLDRCSFEDRELADIDLLVEGAKAPPTAPIEEHEDIPAAAVVNLPPPDQTATVEVRILGPVEIVGATGPCPTQKAEELIVYLALHPSGADGDSLMEALWPKEPPSPGRLRNEVSRARQTLGHGPDREAYLPHASHGRYQLSEQVRLDHDRFRAHLALARDDDQATVQLRAALELVRGRPLQTSSRGYGWAQHYIYPIEAEIVDAAHRLAQAYLEAGPPQQAMWAVERGLRADPLSETLYRDWMRAADAAGDTAQVHAIMDRLRQRVAEDARRDDGDDHLHPDTVATYHELTTRRPTLSAHPPVRPAESDRHAL
ncbi:MAG: bacterial transcriptional activator domain-containing protein, partial [Actinomycetota bacterium]|nr:bacterial transcriptional activator domain-containing protein [Actinomycetota bacterium]